MKDGKLEAFKVGNKFLITNDEIQRMEKESKKMKKLYIDEKLIKSNLFNNLSISSRYLYFMLSIYADEYLTVREPLKILNEIGASKEDFISLVKESLIMSCGNNYNNIVIFNSLDHIERFKERRLKRMKIGD